MPNYRQHIVDACFKINSNLDIISANRSFLRFINKADTNFNLGEKMMPVDIELVKGYLQNYNQIESHKYVIVPFRLRSDYENCLIYISSYENDVFNCNIREFEYLEEVFQASEAFNKESEMVLNFLNAEYFMYDVVAKTYSLKNSEVGFNSFGIVTELSDMLSNNVGIDISKKKNKVPYEKMKFDISNGIAGNEYIFNEGNDPIKIFTKPVTDEGMMTKIIGIVDKENKGVIASEAGKLDGLTLVYNKKAITEIAKNQVDIYNIPSTLFVIDIDHFKEFNDTFGHAYGDEVLLKVSKVLKDTIGASGYVGRIGGDEFMCIIDKTDEDTIRTICRNIKFGIQWAIKAETTDTIVSCSIGVAVYPKNTDTFEKLFDLADKCLYIAKNKGRNCYVFYVPEKHDQIIFKHEEEKKGKVRKVIYAENAEMSLGILSKLYAGKASPKQILKMLKDEFHFYRVTYYDKKLLPIINLGEDKKDIRAVKLRDENYFDHFNEKHMYISDNIADLDTIDRIKYHMYADNDIGSTIEIANVNKTGKVVGLLTFDVHKPARTFKEAELVFIILVSKLIFKQIIE